MTEQGTTKSPPFSQTLAQELLSTYGSPLYVYRADRLRQTLEQITESIAYPHVQFHFASVTNGNIALLQIIQQAGWGLHANTPGDGFLGLQAGFTPDRIVYSGSNLSRTDIQQLIDWQIERFNFDSLSQLQDFCECAAGRLQCPSLGLRLNSPDLTGDSRIGVRPEEFTKATAIAAQYGFTVTGLHFYRGTGTNATRAFTQTIDRVIAIARQLPDWQSLDFGGGFGYSYRSAQVAFDWLEFGTAIEQKLRALPRRIELTIEPGRAAIAACGTLLATVVAVKWQDDRQIVGVDTTVANLSVPAVHGGYRAIATWAADDRRYLTDICGNTTYSRDYLGRNCWLPPLQIGEAIAILDSGAYGYAMSSHFLHRPRPAEVLIEGDRFAVSSMGERHRPIRRREDYAILLNGQLF